MIDWLRREHVRPEITLGERVLPIVLRRHPTAKRLTLRLAPDGSEVRLTAPKWAPTNEAIAFAHARAEWLAGQLAKLPEQLRIAPGASVQFRGQPLLLAHLPSAPRKGRFAGDSVTFGGPVDGYANRVRRWLEAQGLALMEADLSHFCAAAGVEPPQLRLTRAQRRWGSCSTGGTVRINWRLVQAPDPVRRSVVAHEIAHLVHFDHSPAFHALLGRIFDGDIRAADRWLKDHGRTLYAAFG